MQFFKACKNPISILILLHVQINLPAQQVYIYGNIDSKDLNPVNIYQYGVRSDGEAEKKYSIVVKADGQFSASIKNMEEGFFKIGDAYVGHKIYITPGDSVMIQLKKIANPSFEIFHKMEVKTRYPMNYLFFDSCLSFFGRVKPQFSQTNFDDKSYKDSCHDRYERAVRLLNHFHREKMVSDSFDKYARIELQSTYFDWLIFPFAKYHLSKESLNPDYFEEMEGFPFDNLDAIRKTQYYLSVAEEYNNFILNTMDKNNNGPWLYSSFETAATQFKGYPRDRLMAWKIEEIVRWRPEDSSGIESVLSYFLRECKTPSIRNEVTAKMGIWALKLKNTAAAFREFMEKPLYVDLNGNEFSMNSLPVNKRWLLIDCWASWCKPCKIQEPFFEYYKEKYRNSIGFLKLSLDENKHNWKNYISKNGKDTAMNYLVKGGNENAFSYFFDIKAIPRFILFDLKNKKVVNDNMPFPENKEEFEKAVRSVLKEPE